VLHSIPSRFPPFLIQFFSGFLVSEFLLLFLLSLEILIRASFLSFA